MDKCREEFEKVMADKRYKFERFPDLGRSYKNASTQWAWEIWQAAWTASRWIPVSERLPEESGCYCVSSDDGTPFAMLWAEREWCLWTADGLTTFDNITHWQPLPEAPHE